MATNDAPHPTESQSTDFELEQVDIYGKYLLQTPPDILFILRTMLRRGCMATAYFNQGRSFFLTWLLGIGNDEKSLILDASSDAAINREAAQASRIIITANLDNVKIQFILNHLHEAAFDNRPAFIAPLPDSLLRLQRREYFRLETSITDPVRCQIPEAGESDQTLDLALLDISGGGLSLKTFSDTAGSFKTGRLFRNCRIQIPEEPVLTANLCVRNSFPVTSKDGYEYLRVGCEFVNLPGAKLSMIQRYITRIERQRKAKLTGLA